MVQGSPPPIAVAILLLTCELSGQTTCIYGDDGLRAPGGACCPTPTLTLPAFPAMDIDGKYACLFNCAPEGEFGIAIALGAPTAVTTPSPCELFSISIQASFGTASFGGLFLAKYQRTWVEVDSSDSSCRQRWRFLLNADTDWTSDSNIPCPTPPCTLAGGNFLGPHFFGLLDYACDLQNPGSFKAALVLSHLPGCLSHESSACAGIAGQATSPIPVAAVLTHPKRSYHLVAPPTFSFADPGSPFSSLGLCAENSRERNPTHILGTPPTHQCYSESRAPQQGTMGSAGTFCPCASGGPARWNRFSFLFYYTCPDPTCGGTTWNTSDSSPMTATCYADFVNTGLICLRLGTYTHASGPFSGERAYSFFGHFAHDWYAMPCCNSIPPRVIDTWVHGGLTLYPGSRVGILEPIGTFTPAGTIPCATVTGTLVSCSGGTGIRYTNFLDLENMVSVANNQEEHGVQFHSWALWNTNDPPQAP